MAGRQAGNSRIDGARGSYVTEAEEIMYCQGIHIETQARDGKDRFELGAESDSAVLLCDIKRLDAQGVARQGQLAGVAVPDGHGEHALELFPSGIAPLTVRSQDG